MHYGGAEPLHAGTAVYRHGRSPERRPMASESKSVAATFWTFDADSKISRKGLFWKIRES